MASSHLSLQGRRFLLGLLPILGGLLLYVLAGILIYWLFYSNHPYDEFKDEGATAFKVWFWTSYTTHILVTLGGSLLLARFLRAPVPITMVGIVLIVAILAWPTLGVLSFMNTCEGLSFPFGGGSCG